MIDRVFSSPAGAASRFSSLVSLVGEGDGHLEGQARGLLERVSIAASSVLPGLPGNRFKTQQKCSYLCFLLAIDLSAAFPLFLGLPALLDLH